ncbi:MAG: aspartate carbamoyltransferase [Ignavibacteriales bacterium]|nr:aspartate carbamoyltransferase [Ignavibacteriales bacterium]
MEHVISMRDLSQADILQLLQTAAQIENKELQPDISDKVAALLFYEPSTRTVFSFDTAVKRMNGKSIIMAGTEASSVKKGESFSDTVQTVSQYVDIIIIRSILEGAARYASEILPIPIVNAGDGSNQHPTQTMLDLYSIKKTQGTLSNLNIALVGDLRFGRTIHSLVYGLAHFGVTFYTVAPKHLKLPLYIKNDPALANVKFIECDSLAEIIPLLDVMYVTRVQKERFADPVEYDLVKNSYQITSQLITSCNPKENFKILHPLPRVHEITVDVDPLPYAYYFQQAKNGLYIRQAIIATLLGAL